MQSDCDIKGTFINGKEGMFFCYTVNAGECKTAILMWHRGKGGQFLVKSVWRHLWMFPNGYLKYYVWLGCTLFLLCVVDAQSILVAKESTVQVQLKSQSLFNTFIYLQ